MRVSQDKRYNEFITGLLREGWQLTRSKKHYKLLTPDGRIAGFVSTSPGDRRRGFLNFRQEVRRRLQSNA